MAIKNLLKGDGGERKKKIVEKPIIYEREQEKMTAEIADRFRIRVVDASAFKNSYTDWADQWK